MLNQTQQSEIQFPKFYIGLILKQIILINNTFKFGGGQSEMSMAGGHQQQQQQPSTFTGAFQSQQGTSMQPNPMRVINTRPGGGFGNQSQTPQFGSQPTTGIQGGSLFGSAPASAQQQTGQMLASAQRQQIASTTPNIPSDTRVLIRGARFNQAGGQGQQQQQQQQQPQAPSIIQQSQFSLQQQHQQIPQTMQFQQQGQLNQAQQLQQNQQQMRRSMGGMARGGGAAGSSGGPSQSQQGAGPGRGRNF